VLIIKFYMY